MIIQEQKIINDIEYILTYSDKNHYIKQASTGVLFSKAIDLKHLNINYEETDELIPYEDEELEDEEIL